MNEHLPKSTFNRSFGDNGKRLDVSPANFPAADDANCSHDNLKDVTTRLEKAVSSILEIVITQGKLFSEIEESLRTAFIPIAETNSKLVNKFTDENILKIVMLALAHVIDRQTTEADDDQQELPFSVIESCRNADREELLEIMRLFGIEQFTAHLGMKYDGTIHDILGRGGIRPTTDVRQAGRVARIHRVGYWRSTDKWIIRKVLVSVYGLASK